VAANLLRFNTGGSENPELNRWASSGYRIAAVARSIDGTVAAMVFRAVAKTCDPRRRFKMLGGGTDVFFGDPSRVRLSTRVLVVEGLMDWVAASLARVREDSAVLGVRSAGSATDGALRAIFAGYAGSVFILPHNDRAGLALADRVARVLSEEAVSCHVVGPMS
jgi:hypothetical protein